MISKMKESDVPVSSSGDRARTGGGQVPSIATHEQDERHNKRLGKHRSKGSEVFEFGRLHVRTSGGCVVLNDKNIQNSNPGKLVRRYEHRIQVLTEAHVDRSSFAYCVAF